jgi:hypothetical protein
MATATKKSNTTKAKVTVNGKTTLRRVSNITRGLDNQGGTLFTGSIMVQSSPVQVTRRLRQRTWAA